MSGPFVTIDLETIERNARAVVAACAKSGIEVFGVTKGTCGMPQVARAMLRGGVIGIGESRFENIRRLRDSGIDAPILLLRSPPLSRVEEVVASVDISLNTELAIIRELSRVAERMSRTHDIILMVDLGDDDGPFAAEAVIDKIAHSKTLLSREPGVDPEDPGKQYVRTLLDPESDPLGNGWHIIQSQIAVGSGGMFGKGWQHGTQSRLDFLPEHTTDFIFAVFSEEFGLVGVACLMLLYAFIIGRCLWIAMEARDTYSRLLAGAIGMSFFVYVFVNGGMVVLVFPSGPGTVPSASSRS